MQQIPFVQAKDLLRKYKIPLVASEVFTKEEEALGFYKQINGPVAMKIDAPMVWHRTEKGGVLLNIVQESEFRQAWKRFSENSEVQGIIIQKMCSGIELGLGAKRDQQFGPVVLFGLGGIFIELLKDISLRIAPFNIDEARKMIREIKGYELLNGFRGHQLVDQDKLAQILVNLGNMMIENPELEEIDLNPVMAKGDKIEAVDVKIWIKHEE